MAEPWEVLAPLAAPLPAPLVEQCRVLDNAVAARGIYLMTLQAPALAAGIQAGQFIHLRLVDLAAHILRRPLSVFAVDTTAGELQLLYQVVGQGTAYLATLDSHTHPRLDAIGPLGRGWQPPDAARKVLLVGGGLGSAPLHLLAAQLSGAAAAAALPPAATSLSSRTSCAEGEARSRRTHMADACGQVGVATVAPSPAGATPELHIILGAQSAEALACRAAFDAYAPSERIHITTDDGSAGRKGLTTEVAQELLAHHAFDYVATCGPEPMQRAIAQMAREAGVPCEVSLERRMACGIGACLSCAVQTTEGQKRACVDGPVFNAQEVLW